MVKSRRARKTLPATTHCFGPSRLHAQEDIREGVAAVPMITEDLPAGERPRPPTRSPGCHRVRDELSKLTRLGSVLNYSDEQSSNNGDDDDVEPTSSASEMPFLSRPTSSSPDPGHQGPSATHPDTFDRADLTAPEYVTDFKETIARSVSTSDAALAFQRWRISSLKVCHSLLFPWIVLCSQNNTCNWTNQLLW
ncbi:hypothetical protein L7F22_067573 [Adiantum nelumboides]|nr:hypothetical protein [Adiantum nelumboides]